MLRFLMRGLEATKRAFATLRKRIAAFDRRMRKRYRPNRLALVTLAVVAVTMVFTLFVPPYLGLSNDGSLDSVMADLGLARMDPDDDAAYFSYYQRTFRLSSGTARPGTTPVLLKITVQAAMGLDELLTGQDGIFDIRCLAVIYVTLYLAALYPLLCGVLSRVKLYSEGLVLAVFSALVFGDTTLVVRFASLYTQPWELILYVVLVDAVFLIPWKKDAWFSHLMVLGAAVLLVSINPYCSAAILMLSAMYWVLVKRRTDAIYRVAYVLSALVLCVVSVVGIGHMLNSQTKQDK